jgi:hypothetical protein
MNCTPADISTDVSGMSQIINYGTNKDIKEFCTKEDILHHLKVSNYTSKNFIIFNKIIKALTENDKTELYSRRILYKWVENNFSRTSVPFFLQKINTLHALQSASCVCGQAIHSVETDYSQMINVNVSNIFNVDAILTPYARCILYKCFSFLKYTQVEDFVLCKLLFEDKGASIDFDIQSYVEVWTTNTLDDELLKENAYSQVVGVFYTKRCILLAKEAPLYFEKIKHTLQSTVDKLYKSFYLCTVDTPDLLLVCEILDLPYLRDICSLPRTLQILLLENPQISAYYLGKPLYNNNYCTAEIKSECMYIQEHGVEQYFKEQHNNCKQRISSFFGTNIKCYNDNTIAVCDSVYDYSPFDIISFREGNFYYNFVRNEFDYMLTNKKNIAIQTPLPEIIQQQMYTTENIAKEYDLLPAEPLVEMWKKLPEHYKQVDTDEYLKTYLPTNKAFAETHDEALLAGNLFLLNQIFSGTY